VVTKTLWIVGGLDDIWSQQSQAQLPPHTCPISTSHVPSNWAGKQKLARMMTARLLRPNLFGVVADQAEDREFIEQGMKLALAWLEVTKAVDPDMVSAVLNTARVTGPLVIRSPPRSSQKGSRRNLRGWLLSAMGSFRDPAITKVAPPHNPDG